MRPNTSWYKNVLVVEFDYNSYIYREREGQREGERGRERERERERERYSKYIRMK